MKTPEERFQDVMELGHSAAWEGDWNQAVNYYQDALQEYPDNPKALNSLGLAFIGLKRFEDALNCFMRATKIIPEDPLPFEKIAQISRVLKNIKQSIEAGLRAAELYMKNKEVGKALENWTLVTRLAPQNLLAHSRLALVYERLGRMKEAVNEYLVVAALVQQAGNPSKAKEFINHAIRLLPDDYTAQKTLELLNHSHSLMNLIPTRGVTGPLRKPDTKPLEEAQFEKSLSIPDPIEETRQKALAALAELLFTLSEVKQALPNEKQRGSEVVAFADQPLFINKKADINKVISHLNKATELQVSRETTQATQELEHAVSAGLEHPAAYYLIGLWRTQNDRLESALRELQKATFHPEYVIGAYLQIGKNLVRMEKPAEALQAFMEALKLADSKVAPEGMANDLAKLYHPLIEMVTAQNDPELQSRLSTSIINLLCCPDWRKSLLQSRKSLYLDMADIPPIPMLEVLVEIPDKQTLETISNVHSLATNRQFRSAMEEAYYALQHAPTYLPLHLYMADLLLQQEFYPEAVTKLKIIAQAYVLRGDKKLAMAILRLVIKLAPMELIARIYLIELLLSVDDKTAAVDEYIKLAEGYYDQAEMTQARQTYEKAYHLAEELNLELAVKGKVLFKIADIYLQSLEWKQALEIFERIKSLLPEDSQARQGIIKSHLGLGQESQASAEINNFISLLTGIGKRENAIEFLEGLLKECEDQVFIRRRLADLYRQSGRLQEAIVQLDVVAETLLEAGDRLATAEVVESILALNPPNKDEYRQLLTQLRGDTKPTH